MIVPFADNIEGAQTFVIDKNCRPKIKYSRTETDDKDAPFVPNDIAEIIKRCWANDPQERPASISDVSEMLKLITFS